jgi:4-hydroxyacetophenone monooxygenase
MTLANEEGKSLMDRQELRGATDQQIVDAVSCADPILLRGLLYGLTGDEEVAAIPDELAGSDFRGPQPAIIDPEHSHFLRRKAAEFLIDFRDSGGKAGQLPDERLRRAMELTVGSRLPDDELGLWVEQMGLDPMARSFQWPEDREPPSPEQRARYLVLVIGAGMGGLNAAMQLKRAGIPYVLVEKNGAVGGTWYENRYPGARVDTTSLNYFHTFAVDYPCPYPFCPQEQNWIADKFELRQDIDFNTEIKSMAWSEEQKLWEISATGPDGPRHYRANAVISCVGFLNRPNVPDIEGAASFDGPIVHTARWPEGIDLQGKRVAILGSGATGYQTVPEVAKLAGHLTLFQRTPSWCFEAPGYLSPFPPQITWLDRNFPYWRNFQRLQISWIIGPQNLLRLIEAEPGFDHPVAVSENNRIVYEQCRELMTRLMPGRPDLVERMTPKAPPFSSRPILIDSRNNIYDALMRENVELVTEPISRITPDGLVAENGDHHQADVIVYATGFKANDFLWPINVIGREGKAIGDVWKKDGARAYLGTNVPGFPNFFMVYGPNMNPFFNGLGASEMEEMTTRFALKCIAALIEHDRAAIDVAKDAYDRFNQELDRLEATKVYSDHRVSNYYKNEFGRSAVNCPFDVRLLWKWWLDPAGENRPESRDNDPIVRPYIGEDLLVD